MAVEVVGGYEMYIGIDIVSIEDTVVLASEAEVTVGVMV